MELSRSQKEVIQHLAAGAILVHDWLIVECIIRGFSQQGPWDFKDEPEHSWCKKPNERTVKALEKRGLIHLDSRRHCSHHPPKPNERERYDIYKLTELGQKVAGEL